MFIELKKSNALKIVSRTLQIKMLLDTILNSKAVALQFKITPLDLFLINLGKFRKEKSV